MRVYSLSLLFFIAAVTAESAAPESLDLDPAQDLSVLDVVGDIVTEGIENLEDIEHRVNFYLHTRKSGAKDRLLVDDRKTLRNSNFDPKRETKFVTHGWVNSENSLSCTMVKDAFLKVGDFNVIVVDWSDISKQPYGYASMHVLSVAKRVAKMINFLANNGMDLNTTTVVGHSLGAHIAGLSSRYARGKVNYVVGLDPALPLFATNKPGTRISSRDAENVEIIHTNSGMLGFDKPLGKADFYVNGGKQQQGCGVDLVGFCSHERSYEYFAESLVSATGFYGRQCPNERTLNPKLCNGNVGQMGGVRRHLPYEGVYYVTTKSKAPFAIGKKLLR